MQEGWIKLGKLEYRPVHGRYVYNEATRSHDLVPDAEVHHVEIKLTQEQVSVVDFSRLDELKEYKWYADKSCKTYYAKAKRNSKALKMHRFLTNNQWKTVDHKDGNGLMNIDSNLRDGTHVNSRNKVKSRGYFYNQREKCIVAEYQSYEGKKIQKLFHAEEYGTAQLTEVAAQKWYHENALRVIEQIERDGPCKIRYVPKKRERQDGELNIGHRPAKRDYYVVIDRNDKRFMKCFNYRTITKEEALQQAIVWRDKIWEDNPSANQIRKKSKVDVE